MRKILIVEEFSNGFTVPVRVRNASHSENPRDAAEVAESCKDFVLRKSPAVKFNQNHLVGIQED